MQHSVKKVMLTVYWNIKGPIAVDFLEKGATVSLKLSPAIFVVKCLFLILWQVDENAWKRINYIFFIMWIL